MTNPTEQTTVLPGQPASALDLDAYFARIGYTGPRTPTLATLQAIITHHTQTIPFENLNPYFRLPVKLDIAALQNKMVHSQRGGFCFEQNGLLRQVLLALGYQSKPLGARVMWGRPPSYMPPRTHMVQLLTLEGQPYMVDVGFGGMTPTGVLRLEPNTVQATPHEPFRFIPEDEEYILEALVGASWRALYRFDLTEQQPVDYELSNFWVCHHPDSHFISGISAARVEPGRRYALRDNQFTIHHTGGSSEERRLTTVAELCEVLDTTFHITLPAEVDTDQALQSLIG
ncbi:MAG: arylamine N-acetyltransferase [Caldilineaceae bacterium]